MKGAPAGPFGLRCLAATLNTSGMSVNSLLVMPNLQGPVGRGCSAAQRGGTGGDRQAQQKQLKIALLQLTGGFAQCPPAHGHTHLPSRMGARWPHSSDSRSSPAGLPSAVVGDSSRSRRSHSMPQRSCRQRWGMPAGSSRQRRVRICRAA